MGAEGCPSGSLEKHQIGVRVRPLINDVSESLEYGRHDSLEHFKGRPHMLDIAKIRGDVAPRSRRGVHRHSPETIQELNCVPNVSVQRSEEIPVGPLRWKPSSAHG
jgi:hypothetical protein